MECDTVDLDFEIVYKTESAILVTDGGGEYWLPKSQIEGDAGYEAGELCEITMPEWLAEEKGLI